MKPAIPLNAHVLQIWVGPTLPTPIVLECMRRTRASASGYTLVCDPASPLLDVLNPDSYVETPALYIELLGKYPKAGAYLEKMRYDARQVSDVLRFFMLEKAPFMLYVDSDCLVDASLYNAMAHVKHAVLSRFRDGADIFLIHGGHDAAFFTSCLIGVDVSEGPSVLREMVKNHAHRFIPSLYQHLTRSRHHEAPVFLL